MTSILEQVSQLDAWIWSLTEDQYEQFCERAAIRQHDGGRTKLAAELGAYSELETVFKTEARGAT